MTLLGPKQKQKITQGVVGAAYIVWVGQWFWVCLLYMDRLLETPVGKFIKPEPSSSVSTRPHLSSAHRVALPPELLWIVAFIGAAALIGLGMYVVFKSYVPEVQRIAHKTIQKTAAVSTDYAVRHHIIPKRKERVISVRIAFWLRMTMSLLPVVAVFAVQGNTPAVPREIAKAGMLLLTIVALVFVLLHKILQSRWRVQDK